MFCELSELIFLNEGYVFDSFIFAHRIHAAVGLRTYNSWTRRQKNIRIINNWNGRVFYFRVKNGDAGKIAARRNLSTWVFSNFHIRIVIDILPEYVFTIRSSKLVKFSISTTNKNSPKIQRAISSSYFYTLRNFTHLRVNYAR